MVEGNNAIAV